MNWTISNYIFLLLAITSQLLDTVVTTIALQDPRFYECDPLVGKYPTLSFLLLEKIVLILIACTLGAMLISPHLRNRLFALIAGLGAGATVYNIYLMRAI